MRSWLLVASASAVGATVGVYLVLASFDAWDRFKRWIRSRN
jgi:hypothetical protein